MKATIDPRTGVGGRAFGIGFELRLPVDWSGRFMFQGGAGLDGVVSPALGNVPNAPAGPPALSRGFAVVVDRCRAQGFFGRRELRPRSAGAHRLRMANALAEVTREAKAMLAAFYGAPATRSYFVGCSNGGRQALMASQRLPWNSTGSSPAIPPPSFSRLALGEVWNMQVLARIAPRDTMGRPIYAKAFSHARPRAGPPVGA